MHYMNGREAKEGDHAIHAKGYPKMKAGVLHSLTASSQTCNGG